MRIYDIILENDRREFMKRMGKTAAATAGTLAFGSMLPTTAWPKDLPQNFNFMDQFLSDKVLKDPKYQEFKDVGEKLLKMLQDMENAKKKDKGVEV
tara:strand:- start:849 stop:1136 length:288 start_codon:yes stop_codon:yes gene_type:complete